MIFKFLSFVFSSVYFLLPINSQADDLIVGKWVQAELTKGGLGGVFIFYEDGRSIVIFGAIVESRYTVENDTLVETIEGEPSGVPTKYTFKIDNETLVISKFNLVESEDCKKEIKMDRIGGASSTNKSIVGKWIYDHSTGGKALVEYTKSGRKLLCVPMVYETGNYNLEDKKLIIKMENGKTYIRYVKIEKGELILLKSKTKKEEIYYKFL